MSIAASPSPPSSAGLASNLVTSSAEAATQASGSSFYAGMRVLPKAEREGMYAVYSFCRQVDDIADDLEGAQEDRRDLLNAWRADLAALYAGGRPERTAFLAEPVARFGLRQADFLAVIDGMEMDVDHDIRAPDLETLDLYCDRVASAVGRLSVKVFGMDEAPGLALAHHLGRALQLTNILRDLDEDATIGRLYMPAELLREAGIESDDPAVVVDDPRLAAAAAALAARAQAHYAAAQAVLAARPQGRMIAPRLMYGVYSRILERMTKIGWAAPRSRVRVGKLELIWILIRRGLLG
jgi:phytoene synthase